MSLDEAIALLKIEYAAASKAEWVQKPMAYALYQVWKMADGREPHPMHTRRIAEVKRCMEAKE